MTFTELKKRAGKELNLLDSSDSFLIGRDITETQLGDSINDAYLHDVIGAMSEQYPMLYEMEAYSPNYVSTSTVTSISALGVLVTPGAIFLAGHEGCNIYNATRDNYYNIETYTSTTEVILATVPTNWVAGDTLYLLEKDYTFGGDATDYIENLSVWIRFGDVEYLPATMKLFDDTHVTGYETFEKDAPVYLLKTFATNNGLTIYPLFESNDTKAVKMRYLQMPTALSSDTDVPKLPLNHQSFLFWRAVEEGAIARKDTGLAQYAQQKYELGRSRLLASFKPLRNLKPQRDIQSHFKYIKNKDY